MAITCSFGDAIASAHSTFVGVLTEINRRWIPARIVASPVVIACVGIVAQLLKAIRIIVAVAVRVADEAVWIVQFLSTGKAGKWTKK